VVQLAKARALESQIIDEVMHVLQIILYGHPKAITAEDLKLLESRENVKPLILVK